MKKFLAVLLALALAVATLTVPAMAASKVKTVVKLSHGGTVTLNIGENLQLSAAVTPEAPVTWTSSKAKYATVDSSGLVHAVAEGTATIKAKAGKKSAKVKVKVVNPNKPTGISLDRSGTVKLPMNETLTLTATLQPSTAVGNVTWKTSNKKVATVNGGVVTPKKKGTVTITAKVGKKSAKVKIKVVSASEHQHVWEPVYTTNTVVDTPAWDETVVDTPAWDETVVDTPATTQTVNHLEEGHYEQVEHKAEGHYETKTVTDKEAWVEQVPIYKDRWVVTQEAWTEKTKLVTGVKCYCGKIFKTYDEYNAHENRNNLVKDYYNGYWDSSPEGKKAIEDAYGNPPTGDGDLNAAHNGYSICSYEVDLDPSEWIEHPEEGIWENYFTGEYETVVHPAETHTEQVWVVDKPASDEQVWVVDKQAWTETVDVPAVTHNVHHDAVTHVVHHDAVTHVENVQTGRKCSGCGAVE